MDDLPVHTTPNNPPKQNLCSFKNFSSNHPWRYSKWLVRHSSMSTKQQRRPLPSLLYKYFFYTYLPIIGLIEPAHLLAQHGRKRLSSQPHSKVLAWCRLEIMKKKKHVSHSAMDLIRIQNFDPLKKKLFERKRF